MGLILWLAAQLGFLSALQTLVLGLVVIALLFYVLKRG